MVARSVWTMRACQPVEPEGVPLGPVGMVKATPEVAGTRAMGVAGMTVDLEDMDMEEPKTMVATRVVLTAI